MSGKDFTPLSKAIEETRRYHTRYLRAINNPLRRKILRALQEGHTTLDNLQCVTGLAKDVLDWHLTILESGFCVEKENKAGKLIYKLTKEGQVIDFLE